jgi:hypothetical protein
VDDVPGHEGSPDRADGDRFRLWGERQKSWLGDLFDFRDEERDGGTRFAGLLLNDRLDVAINPFVPSMK